MPSTALVRVMTHRSFSGFLRVEVVYMKDQSPRNLGRYYETVEVLILELVA